jgi:hypothetical protein
MSKPNQKSATDKAGPKIANSKRAGQRKGMNRPVFQPNAAGIDIGAREIFVAVPPERDPDPVRKCETFTGDLHQMAEWLVRCGITRRRWSLPACIGFRCTTYWSSTVSNRVW